MGVHVATSYSHILTRTVTWFWGVRGYLCVRISMCTCVYMYVCVCSRVCVVCICPARGVHALHGACTGVVTGVWGAGERDPTIFK